MPALPGDRTLLLSDRRPAAEHVLLYLAGCSLRKFVHKRHTVRRFEVGQILASKIDQVTFSDRCFGFHNDKRLGVLGPSFTWISNNRDFLNSRMSQQHSLNFYGR